MSKKTAPKMSKSTKINELLGDEFIANEMKIIKVSEKYKEIYLESQRKKIEVYLLK